MRVCVVGGGAREHALAHVLARTSEVIVTPGNPGIATVAECTPADATEIDADLFVIGPEAPLVGGLADRLRNQGKLVFGPGADGARLEGSKKWMKQLLVDAGIPTARYAAFDDERAAIAYLREMPGPWVVKTDGLAAGKGVLVTDDRAEAEADVREKLTGVSFGDAGRTIVIEEAMEGAELSILAVCDGTRAVALAPAQDFKRLGDGDAGPNTGGMGAYSPVPVATDDLIKRVMAEAVQPTLDHLRDLGIDYRGVLYCGLMLTADGPKVVEFNVRFGDPEAEAVLPRFAGDLAAFLAEAASGDLRSKPDFVDDAAVAVVLAAPGYPTSPATGGPITGLDAVAGLPGVTVFHGGTALGDADLLVTAGGRVLVVTGMGSTLADARRRAYEAAWSIGIDGVQHRNDIAMEASCT
ncbi:MAG TPA: phosphoribosylamine--glycine ligase [Acidimicrobiales bacterium]|nr:phosphoribosylamine--glycine ligase [Acidimicrobiales bacterium]